MDLTAPPLPDWLERELPFRRRLVDVGGLRMHVMEQGPAEAQPVVMLHGNPSWGYLWRKVAGALKGEELRIVMPDLIGLGLSDKPRNAREHTLEKHIRWFGSCLDQIVPGKLILVVQDWGGAIGLGAMAERAERLAGLVLCNTVIAPPRPGFRPTTFHRFAHTPGLADLVFRLGFPQNVMHLAQGDRKSIAGDVARAYRWPLRRLRDRVAPLALARMVPNNLSHPSMPALARCLGCVDGFTGPAAIVWGDRDPVIGRVRSFIERRLPSAKVTRTDAGHFLQEEAPVEIAAAVRDVAARLH